MERNKKKNASFAFFLLGFCWMLPRKAGVRLERREDGRQRGRMTGRKKGKEEKGRK
jgi:hypothetical protein